MRNEFEPAAKSRERAEAFRCRRLSTVESLSRKVSVKNPACDTHFLVQVRAISRLLCECVEFEIEQVLVQVARMHEVAVFASRFDGTVMHENNSVAHSQR